VVPSYDGSTHNPNQQQADVARLTCGWESHSCFGETGYFVMEVLDGRMVQSLNRDEDQYDQYPTEEASERLGPL
jgi:hypothetical protein